MEEKVLAFEVSFLYKSHFVVQPKGGLAFFGPLTQIHLNLSMVCCRVLRRARGMQLLMLSKG